MAEGGLVVRALAFYATEPRSRRNEDGHTSSPSVVLNPIHSVTNILNNNVGPL